ncbi:MAG TPA: hypothetical protein VLI06_10195 [Solimonas sp.]|nr:hypothetical protein [Solimonas sp.]
MRAFVPLLMLLGSLVAWSAQAEPRQGRHEGRMEFRGSDQRMSLKDAANRAQRQHGGRVLAADEDGFGGYRVKLLKDGEVRTVHVPP